MLGSRSGPALMPCALLILMTLGMASCAPISGGPVTTPSPADGYQVARCNGQPLPRAVLNHAPPVAPASVYVGSVGGLVGSPANLYAFAAASGTLRWCDSFSTTLKPRCTSGRCPPPGLMIVGQPLLAAGVLYVCVPGVTYALSAGDGGVRWQRETGCEITAMPFADYAQPILAGGLLYSGSFALDPRDGSIRWRLPPNSSPGAVGDGMLYAYSEEFIYALDAATGKLRWQYVFDEVAGARPVVAGDLVEVSDLDFEVTAFTVSSGNAVWRRYIANFSSISAGCGTSSSLIYVGAGPALYAVDAASGRQIWAYQTGGRAYPSMASCAGDTLYFTGDSIYAVSAATGARRWQTSVGGPYLTFTTPTLVDGILFVGETGSVNGVLYALSASTGNVLWHVGGIDQSQPPVAG